MMQNRSTEASALRKISTKNKSEDDSDRRNILINAIPGPQKLTAPTKYSTSTRHQALDLHGSHQPPFSLEFSQQPNSAGEYLESFR